MAVTFFSIISVSQELDDQTRLLIYPRIRPYLQRACDMEGLDFDKTFPVPAGFKEADPRQLLPVRPSEPK